ncbi:MAG: SUF system Fe-S cluster assembly regulator [Acidobacteriota bacterium]|nr:MAG: SUF system Fe-S cluster assembly regulator [Acidobacteriota bacterium]
MIRMSKFADYGLVLMTQFLRASSAEENLSARELASQTRLPLPMVSKVLKALTREGLLVSHRGASGGYSLSRSPAKISVAEVLTAVEGPIAMTECLDSTSVCKQESVCPVRTNWERINFAVQDVLDAISLADMLEPLPDHLVTLGVGETETPSHRQ